MDVHSHPRDLQIFDALPSPHLLLDRDFLVMHANPAYAGFLGCEADEITGRHIATVLSTALSNPSPPSPPPPQPSDGAPVGDRQPEDEAAAQDTAEDGIVQLCRALEHVLLTGRPESLPVQSYPHLDLGTGQRSQRWWSSTIAPVLDESGQVQALVHRVQDLTDYLTDREARTRRRGAEERWQARALHAEVELFTQAQRLQAAREAERAQARQLAALAEVTLGVAGASDVAELTDLLVGRGLSALGAQGGAIAVRAGDVVDLTITASLGEDIQLRYSQLPLDSRLPAAVTTATGRRILLPDLAATLAYAGGREGVKSAEEIVAVSGCQAWACLPLKRRSTSAGNLHGLGSPDSSGGADGSAPTSVHDAAGEPALGALLVGWRQAQTFTAAELDVLEALAAQCAQTLTRLQDHHAEQQRAHQTSQLAEALQRSLLSDPVHPDGLQVATRYHPASESARVGGDWYDGFVTSAGVSTLVVGDVCGHDREAAAAMAQVRNILRGIAWLMSEPPAEVLRHLDRALPALGVDALASAIVVTVEQDADQRANGEHRLRWSNAGHPPPLLVHPDGCAQLLRTPAELLLGLDPDTSRCDHDVLVPPGSTVLLYTDGLVERRGGDLDEGLEALARNASALLADVGAQEGGGDVDLGLFCDELLQRMSAEIGGSDDVVVLALRT